MTLRTSRPAPTSSTRATASSPMAKAARTRRPRTPSDPVRPPSFRCAPESRRAAWSAGTMPKSRPVSRDAPRAYAITCRSTAMFASRGRPAGARVCRSSVHHAATSRPAAPPIRPSSRLSVSIWRSSRRRPAPSAARIASSRCLEAARVSSRFATLAQAISRTKHTAPSRMISGRLTSPTISSCSGTRRIPIPAFDWILFLQPRGDGVHF